MDAKQIRDEAARIKVLLLGRGVVSLFTGKGGASNPSGLDLAIVLTRCAMDVTDNVGGDFAAVIVAATAAEPKQ